MIYLCIVRVNYFNLLCTVIVKSPHKDNVYQSEIQIKLYDTQRIV